jgi:predicted GIY-YIG superfamily endonuclease
VGLTQNLDQRMNQHFSGNGAKWTQKHKPISINHIQECKTYDNAKKAEVIVYEKMRDYHGQKNVRGAYHTNSKSNIVPKKQT